MNTNIKILFDKMEAIYPKGWKACQPEDGDKPKLFAKEWQIRLAKLDQSIMVKALDEWVSSNKFPPKISEFLELYSRVKGRSGIAVREDNQLKSRFETVRRVCDEQYAAMMASRPPVAQIQRYRRVMAYNELCFTRGINQFVTPEDECGKPGCHEKISRINQVGVWVCDNDIQGEYQ